MKIHGSITLQRIIDSVEADDQLGICLACGEDHDGYVEPDARKYTCGSCGQKQVYGTQEIMFMIHA